MNKSKPRLSKVTIASCAVFLTLIGVSFLVFKLTTFESVSFWNVVYDVGYMWFFSVMPLWVTIAIICAYFIFDDKYKYPNWFLTINFLVFLPVLLIVEAVLVLFAKSVFQDGFKLQYVPIVFLVALPIAGACLMVRQIVAYKNTEGK